MRVVRKLPRKALRSRISGRFNKLTAVWELGCLELRLSLDSSPS